MNPELVVRQAVTAQELDALYHARHRVFVEEMGYYTPHPSNRWVDHFDALPITRNFITLHDGRIVAGVRAIETSELGSPFEGLFDFAPHVPAGCRALYLSAWHIEKPFRGPHFRISEEMARVVFDWACRQGFEFGLAVVSPMAEPTMWEQGWEPLAPRFIDQKTGLSCRAIRLDIPACVRKQPWSPITPAETAAAAQTRIYSPDSIPAPLSAEA